LYRTLKHRTIPRLLRAKNVSGYSVVLLVIPLVLSAITHIWNPVGFPSIHTDEGHYTRRGIYVSEGLGPQEASSRYDHPYFGWLFLGSIFSTINYPDFLSAKSGDVGSIEAVWSIPRIIMGVLAVVDTFLIYKIAQTRFNRNTAFIAAVIFAVMPSGWLTRSVFLESILLPLLLLSIFFAISFGTNLTRRTNEVIRTNDSRRMRDNIDGYGNKFKQILLVSISGIFLGLAIFVKVPTFSFIPLVGFLVYIVSKNNQQNEAKDKVIPGINKNKSKSRKNSLKILVLWLIPVVLIPLIWPAFAISQGQYQDWSEGINYQSTRPSKPLVDHVRALFSIDPILLIIGIAGIGYSAVIKREFLFLIWIGPFLIFLYLIDYVSSFFSIPIIPPLCIAAALMIEDLSSRIFKNRNRIKKLLPFGIVSVIATLGLMDTTVSISGSENSNYLQVAAAVTRQFPAGNGFQDGADAKQDGQMTVIGNPRFYWIFQYVYDRPDFSYKTQYNLINIHTLEKIMDGSEKVIMIADKGMLEIVTGERSPDNAKAAQRAERLSEIYAGTELEEKIDDVEIRTNY
jgi:hypothetical protein